ncbi:hypothetical protein BDW62DRAFT_209327 [Aspergillus aurantiobrunneus]
MQASSGTVARLGKSISKLARCGGPDLSDIRNYPAPFDFCQFSMDPTESSNTRTKQKPGSTTVYDPHFEDHLISHGVYPPFYRHPNGAPVSKPENLAEIQSRLQAYAEFAEANARAIDEPLVIKDILPILEGKGKEITAGTQTSGGHLLKNLAPLTDGTIAMAKPDIYHGAHLEQLHPDIQEQINNQIIPSRQSNRPIAPNFFIEAKGHEGSIAVARRQATYDGALGARAMHPLQQFGHENSNSVPTDYDNKANTVASTYHSGYLGLHVTHATRARFNNNPDHCTDYPMTQEQRDKLIEQANERCVAGHHQGSAMDCPDEAGENVG